MSARGWILGTMVFLAVCAGMALWVHAQEEESSLDVDIATVRPQVVEGQAIWLQITLVNRSALAMTHVTVAPAGHGWTEGQKVESIEKLPPGRRDIQLDAVPLTVGEIYPTVGVTYTIDGETYHQLARSGDAVQVEPLSSLVECRVVHQRTAGRQGRSLPMEVWVTNRSPFTLTSLDLEGIGDTLQWATIPPIADLLPQKTTTMVVSPTVRSKHIRVGVLLSCRWTDEQGVERSGTRLCESDTIAIQEEWWEQVLKSVTGLGGILIPALVGLAVWLIQDLVGRWKAYQANRDCALGMLHIIATQTLHGANRGAKVSLDMMEKLFTEKGLYVALRGLDRQLRRKKALADLINSVRQSRRKTSLRGSDRESQSKTGLIDGVRQIWQTAYLHNEQLAESYGSGHAADLGSQAQHVQQLLQTLSGKPKR